MRLKLCSHCTGTRRGRYSLGENVTAGTRYIIAGFVGHNRHCCSIKYARWRGIFGFLRVFCISRQNPDKLNELPLHDFLLYREGLVRLGGRLRV